MKNLLSLLFVVLVSGCASVSVVGYDENPHLAPGCPLGQVTVPPAKAVFDERSGAGEAHYRGNLSDTLFLEPGGHPRAGRTEPVAPLVGGAMAKATAKQIARFTPNQKGSSPLLIDSRILVQRPGSRALRTLIGLGAGKTHFETKTHVYNMEKSTSEPWLVIWTVGGSGRDPGAIFAATPSPILAFNGLAVVGTTISLVNGAGKGLTQDAKRTGKTIGSFVLEKLRQRGAAIKQVPVKRLHEVPVPLVGEVTVPFAKQTAFDHPTQFLSKNAE